MPTMSKSTANLRIHGNTQEERDEFFSSQDVASDGDTASDVDNEVVSVSILKSNKPQRQKLKRKNQPQTLPIAKRTRSNPANSADSTSDLPNRNITKSKELAPSSQQERSLKTPSLQLGSSPKQRKMKASSFIKQALFKGMKFFMVPTRPTSKVFQTKSNKFKEYGADVITSFTPSVSHILVDPDYDGKRVLNYLHATSDIKSNIKKGVIKLVRGEWPSNCIERKTLLPESSFLIPLPSSSSPTPISPPKSSPISSSPATSPIHSHQSKGHFKREYSPPTDPSTPKELSPTSDISILQDSPKDELDLMMKQAELEAHASTFLSDDEIENALSSYKSKYSDPSGPRPLPKRTSDGRVLKGKWDAFLCMKEGENNSSNSDEPHPNDRTIQILSLMLDHYEAESDQWRSQGYRKAIKTLKNQKIPIRTAAQAIKLPGIGQRIADKIEEINKTGDLQRLKFAEEEGKGKVLGLFKGIYGVGPKIGNKWYNEGLRTLEDVEKRTDLTSNQRISLEHYDEFAERMPRDIVTLHYETVVKAVHEIDSEVEATAMGSYRRLQPDCGDIDIILSKPNASKRELCVILAQLLDKLFDNGFAKYTFGGIESDSMRWLGATAHPADDNKWRRMDILLVPWEERGASFIYYTGNDIFNRSMRLLAQRKGYRLNEKGLFLAPSDRKAKGPSSVGPLVCGDSEQKIFEILGVPYRPPHKRVIG